MKTEQRVSASEDAAMFKSYLEARGAIFTINKDGHLRVDLDAVQFPAFTGCRGPEHLSRMLLALAEELKAILRAERTRH